MTTCRLLALLSLAALLSLPGLTQDGLLGPALPKSSNLAFGWVAVSGVDPTLDMLTQFAPTMMCMRDAGYQTGGEGVACHLVFGDFKLNTDIAAAITTLGPGLVRISHFGYDSNSAELAGMGIPGVLFETSGDAIELSYAQHVGNSTIGVSVIPMDTSRVKVETSGITAMTGETKTDFGVRVGGFTRLPHNVKAGIDFSYQEDTGTSRVNPALVPGATDWVTDEETFITRSAAVGLSWQARPTTAVYGSVLKIRATGDNIGGSTDKKDASVTWLGMQQALTDTVALRMNYLGGGFNTSIRWISPIGVINTGYTHKVLLNAKDMLGEGDSYFFSLAAGF